MEVLGIEEDHCSLLGLVGLVAVSGSKIRNIVLKNYKSVFLLMSVLHETPCLVNFLFCFVYVHILCGVHCTLQCFLVCTVDQDPYLMLF